VYPSPGVIVAEGVTENVNAGVTPPVTENPSVPTLEMLHRFMLRVPVIAVLLVTVRALVVSVPVV
jgi:hypothetical protein